MYFMTHKSAVREAVAAGAFVLLLALTLGAARAQDKTYPMKITLATINDSYSRSSRIMPPRSRRIRAATSSPRSIRRAN